MIQLDTRLPLMAQGPNVLAAMDAGTVAAGNTANLLRQAEGQNLFRQYGAGAMQGDPNAMNALAGFDPVMAQGMDINRQENRRADQRLAIDQERLQIVRQETARAVSEAQNKAEAESQVRMLEQAFRAMDMGMRTGDMRAVTQGLRMFGLEQLPPQEGMQLAATMLAGGIEGLTAQYMPQEPQEPLSPAGKLAADFQAGRITQEQFDAASKANPAVVVDMGGGSDKQVFDAMNESAIAARAAVTGYRGLLEAKQAVDAGIISGFGADQRLGLQRLAAALGAADTSVIENTETFRAAIAPQVAAVMKATVGSTQISNADREFAERAAGGSIQLDANTIKRLIGIMEKASRATVEGHMERLNRVYPDPAQYPRERALFEVALPDTTTEPPPPPAPKPTPTTSLYPTFDAFSTSQTMQNAAKAAGVTLEDMWEVYQKQQSEMQGQ
jgi:hypothetical protein